MEGVLENRIFLQQECEIPLVNFDRCESTINLNSAWVSASTLFSLYTPWQALNFTTVSRGQSKWIFDGKLLYSYFYLFGYSVQEPAFWFPFFMTTAHILETVTLLSKHDKLGDIFSKTFSGVKWVVNYSYYACKEKTFLTDHLTLPLRLQNSDFTSAEAALEQTVAAQSSQSSGRTQSEETAHTTSLGAHGCPSAHRCCSCRICAPTQTHCAPRPRCGSTGLHTCLPTRSPPAWHHGHLGRNAHPTCHPTWTTHRPLNVQPTCRCISRCHHCRHTPHPTCRGRFR